MGQGIRYTEEFKRDAVTQVVERGYSVKEVSERLGIYTKSMYDWIKKFHHPSSAANLQTDEHSSKIPRLEAELRRV